MIGIVVYSFCLDAGALVVISAMHFLFYWIGLIDITKEANHILLAWMNFLPTRRKSFSWWVVS